MTRGWWLSGLVVCLVACGGELAGSNDPRPDSGSPASCTPVCERMFLGGCSESLLDCAKECDTVWRHCSSWSNLASCVNSHGDLACSAQGSLSACAEDLAACSSAAADGGGLLDCKPGEIVPACACGDAGAGSPYPCPDTGKYPACPC